MLSYQPQGRCTWRCSVCSLRPARSSSATICLTSWLRLRSATSTASGVSTTTTSSRPTTPTRRLVACTSVLRLSRSSASPCAGVAGRVLGADLPDGLPGAEVVPAGVQRHHAQREGAGRGGHRLHHRVVDRLGRDRGERVACPGARSWRRVLRACPGRCAWRAAMSGAEALQRGQPHRGAQHEHAAVPEVAAVGQVALRGGQVGLLDEARDAARRRAVVPPARM